MSLPRTHARARLPLRLPAELLAEIRQHAQEQGLSLSDWCRLALRQQMARDRLVRRLRETREAFRDQVFIESAEE